MRVITIPDSSGRPFEVYVGRTKSGEPVYVDKALADLSKRPQAMLAAEVRAAEASEK
jgi:hypothetical protein